MNFYVTSGTPDYMEKLIAKNEKEPLILLHGNGNSIVLHETEKKSIFAVPRKFEVLDSKGTFEQKYYFTIYNMSIMSDERPVFEKKALEISSTLKTNDGVIAYRLLRPVKAEIYLLIIQWGGPASFEAWKSSGNYQSSIAPVLEGTASTMQSIFDSSSYITTYSASPKE
ncbi:Target of RNAIII-activating protein [Lysinibacillus sp. 2017]|uniref:antibiotic biosynthesis monooxygenase family protein n=1 Tax=unclassified Lysinibacillus TaxID=2636778 RepID=UPI000D526FE5|nr:MULTISPECIES: antibiotic biosynthesis monooxygenase [unclassified Lysinibacillus]AWE08666.1 Target of RNAIII-activating protein [Lysinibacillus sp. 2017]TGN35087.1 Target of RNAIII-activating protein [Lysinibacillus sp. S2017]